MYLAELLGLPKATEIISVSDDPVLGRLRLVVEHPTMLHNSDPQYPLPTATPIFTKAECGHARFDHWELEGCNRGKDSEL